MDRRKRKTTEFHLGVKSFRKGGHRKREEEGQEDGYIDDRKEDKTAKGLEKQLVKDKRKERQQSKNDDLKKEMDILDEVRQNRDWIGGTARERWE